MQEWMEYALNSVPMRAQREVQIEVHTEVEAVLSKLQTCELASITRPPEDHFACKTLLANPAFARRQMHFQID